MEDELLFAVVAVIWVAFGTIVFLFIRFLEWWHGVLDWLHRHRF